MNLNSNYEPKIGKNLLSHSKAVLKDSSPQMWSVPAPLAMERADFTWAKLGWRPVSLEGSFVPYLPITTAKAVAKSYPITLKVLSSSTPAEMSARSYGTVQGAGKER